MCEAAASIARRDFHISATRDLFLLFGFDVYFDQSMSNLDEKRRNTTGKNSS